ncbi:alpha/beta hydrolase [Herbiconiux moechotypicola]|uniref:Alpha/beta fold hydrolase n=1 Tax=Herbiconiux moechotypicola TaxID=637393 RepID=A0ABN3DCJ8_9MICO|nr:alpha/beta hydrolase [Herbiconiux moechotypicola]MCS5728720.1 alpha/beta hydrolase [Herbiconiux moechotypicola]
MSIQHTSNPGRDRVETRLGHLHVRHYGGDGQATVLWPSMFVDGHSWNLLIPLLLAADHDRHLIVVDPPGLGASDPLTRVSSIAEAADAAVDLLTASGLEHTAVDWVGNAFGGHVGFELATRPGVVRSLAAISSPAEAIPAGLRRQITLLAPLLRTFGPIGPVRRAVVTAMLTERSAARPELVRIVRESLERPTRRSLARALRSFILDRVDVSESLGRIRVPALYLASDDRGDWSPSDAARSAAATPHARAVTIAGARTLIPLEQPEALCRELMRFWKGL